MNIRCVSLKPHHLVGLHEIVVLAELPSFFGRAFATVAAYLGERGERPCGPPISFYEFAWRGPAEKVEVTAGYPVEDAIEAAPGLTLVTLPGGPAATTVHWGPYERLHETYAVLTRWMAAKGHTPAAMMWEQYVVGPSAQADPARWRTNVIYPFRPATRAGGVRTHVMI
jgi:effector-binding domain-containing protein